MKTVHLACCAALVVIFGSAISGAQSNPYPEARPGPVYVDPNNAGPDFVTQGEYVTEGSASQKYGAQVVALGEGKFQVVLLPGGLPGAGSDGKDRIELQAGRNGSAVTIEPANGYEGSIENGTLTLKKSGDTISLHKTIRHSPREGAKAPAGATVLFDCTNTDAWKDGKMDDRHLLEWGTKTKQKYQDFTLHVEYMLSFMPNARDQARSNSGIYMQDRYEVQILDTFGHPPEFNGIGSLYRQHAPSVNMCYPPLQWQTYDIEFHAAKFDENGKKIKNASVTVNHNGVIVQDHYSITAKTGAGKKEGPEAGPIQLQGHHDPVFFRNVWVIAH
ncbi:MAG TPA: DUF1080 domain-containing protein [Tepidisphaeraceae bacterium]|nr:DUF1080 domain-containing protein [Tepidisphaeraceae bacterium]